MQTMRTPMIRTPRGLAILLLVSLVMLLVASITGCKIFNEKETFHTQSYKETLRDSLIYLPGDAVRSNLDSLQIARLENYLKTHGNDTIFIKNRAGNLNLKYYLDQFGQLQVECEKKDATINALIKTIEKHDSSMSSQKETIVKTEHRMTWWGWVIIGVLSAIIIYLAIRRLLI